MSPLTPREVPDCPLVRGFTRNVLTLVRSVETLAHRPDRCGRTANYRSIGIFTRPTAPQAFSGMLPATVYVPTAMPRARIVLA